MGKEQELHDGCLQLVLFRRRLTQQPPKGLKGESVPLCSHVHLTCHPVASADCIGHGSLWAPLIILQPTSHLHDYTAACLELEYTEGERERAFSLSNPEISHVNLYKLSLLTLHVSMQPEDAGFWVPQRPSEPVASLLPPLLLHPVAVRDSSLFMDLKTSTNQYNNSG